MKAPDQQSTRKLGIIGLWHQGTVAAACLADLGYDVVGVDADEKRVAALNAGRAPLYEPGLDELLGESLQTGRLRFSSDITEAVRGRRDVLVMFDSPVDENDRSDLSEVRNALCEMAPHLEPDTTILVTAQVPVGTCDELAVLVREVNPAARFGIAYSPENLRLGQAIERFRNPTLPVLGADDPETLDRVEELLAPLAAKWERVSLRTAEMTKHGLNAFLAASICFGNELGNLCEEVGADGKRLAEILRLEPRVGASAMLLPGLGFSGGTIARDVQALRRLGERVGLETRFLDGIWEANRNQNRLVVRKLKKHFASLEGLPVTVLGLTYKPDTSTLRRSAALEIIADLVKEGATVAAHDPRANREELAAHTEFCFHHDAYRAAEGAEVLVLITGWSEYRELDFERIKKLMARPVILDTNNMLEAEALTSLGFTYMDIGRGRRS